MNSLHTEHCRGKRACQMVLASAVLLLVAGALIRMANLADFPFQIHNDETASIVDGIQYFMPGERGGWALFGSAFGGHPNLSYWLNAIPSRIIGEVTLWSSRLGASIFGTLSMVLFSTFVFKAFGSRIGLFFLALIVPYHYHVHFSRTAFPYIHALVGTAAVSLAFVWFVQKPSIVRALTVGICMGLAALTYPATHVLPAAIACAVVLGVYPSLIRERGLGRATTSVLIMSLSFVVGILIALSPEILYAMRNGYTSRLSSTFIFHPQNIKHLGSMTGLSDPTTFDVFLFNMGRTLEIFYKGDTAEQYQFNENPLPIWGAALGVVGLLVLLVKSFRREPISLYILAASIATIGASGLMVEGNFSPHLIVLAFMIPLAMALGWSVLLDAVRCRHMALAGIITVLLGLAWADWNWKFYNRIVSPERSRIARITNYLLHLPIEKKGVTEIIGVAAHNIGPNESYYKLIYPNSTQVQLARDLSVEQVLQKVAQGRGGVIIVEEEESMPGLEAGLKNNGKAVQVFRYPNMPVGFLYAE